MTTINWKTPSIKESGIINYLYGCEYAISKANCQHFFISRNKPTAEWKVPCIIAKKFEVPAAREQVCRPKRIRFRQKKEATRGPSSSRESPPS